MRELPLQVIFSEMEQQPLCKRKREGYHEKGWNLPACKPSQMHCTLSCSCSFHSFKPQIHETSTVSVSQKIKNKRGKSHPSMQTTAYVLQAIFHNINLIRFENAEQSNHFLTTIDTDSTYWKLDILFHLQNIIRNKEINWR